jgi:soluble lytic murein transglycosylase
VLHSYRRRLLPVLFVFLAAVAGNLSGTPSGQVPSVLDPLASRYTTGVQETLAAIGRGINQFINKQYAACLQTLPIQAAARQTAIPDYVAFYRGRAYLELGRGKEALEILRSFREQFPDSSLSTDALLAEVRSLLQIGNPEGALAGLEAAGLQETADTLSLRAQALKDQGKTAAAEAIHWRIFCDYADSSQAAASERILKMQAPDYLNRPQNRDAVLRRAENLIKAGKSSEARLMLMKIGTAGPQFERIRLLLADAGTNLNLPAEAVRLLSQISDPAFKAQATYLQGVCYRSLKNETAFLAARDRALRDYPRSPFTEKLLYSVATYYDVNDNLPAAKEAYKAIADGFPKGEYAERALWKVGFYSYLEKRYPEAMNGFWRCLLANPSPNAASAPAFWMGRICEKLADYEKAAYFYRRVQALANSSYYGQKARESSAAIKTPASVPLDPAILDFPQAVRILEAIAAETANFPDATPEAVRLIERARQLNCAQLSSLAVVELEKARSESSINAKPLCYAISRIHEGKNDHLNAIISLRRAFPGYIDLPSDSFPRELWNIFFPMRHLDLIKQNASRHQLDPDLVLALIRQESAFQDNARSRADARGLMQLLPSTGRQLARQAGINRYSASRLYSPEINLTLGSNLLSSLLERYDGKVELALAAYNAGASRVDSWLRTFGNLDLAEFVERIPFSETRGYVKVILSNMAHYHLLAPATTGTANLNRKD